MIISTRPSEHQDIGNLRAATGRDVIAAPMFQYMSMGSGPISLGGYDALVFTSRFGVTAAAPHVSERAVKTFAVGPGTAEDLRSCGFQDVKEAGGTAQDLVSLLRSSTFTRALYLSGADITLDLSQLDDLPVDRRVVYRMILTSRLPPVMEQAAESSDPWIVPLYSVRACQTFEALIQRSSLAGKVAQATAVFISQKVASSSALSWGRKIISPSCDADGMAEAIRLAA